MESEEDVSFESDEDHNPVLVERGQGERDPIEESAEEHLQSNEGCLMSCQILKSDPEDYFNEGKIYIDEVDEKRSSNCQSVGFEQDEIEVFVTPEERAKINVDSIQTCSQVFEMESDGYLSESEIIIKEIEDENPSLPQANVLKQETGNVEAAQDSEKDQEIDIFPGNGKDGNDPVEIEMRENDKSLYSFEENGGNETVSKTLTENYDEATTQTNIELEIIISHTLMNLHELNLFLFSENPEIVYYDGENKMQAPFNWLVDVLEITPNLQRLSAYFGNPPENLSLHIPLPNLPHLTKLNLDNLERMPRVDYAPFEAYFPQLLELQFMEFNCWKNDYNQGHFPNLRILILGGISGIEAHWRKVLKVFHTFNAPSLKVLELRLNHQGIGEKSVDVENALRIGTAALKKRFQGKWEGKQTEIVNCGCKKLRFSINSEGENENDALESQKEVANCYQRKTLKDFRNIMQVETSLNSAGSSASGEMVSPSNFGQSSIPMNEVGSDDTATETIIELEIIIEYEEEDHPKLSNFQPDTANGAANAAKELQKEPEQATDPVNIVSEIKSGFEKEPSKVKKPGIREISEEDDDRISRTVEEVGEDSVKKVEEDSRMSTLKQMDLQELTLTLFAGNPMQSGPANIFYAGENVVQAPLTSLGKVLELTPNLQNLSVYWNPPSEILRLLLPLPSLPHLTKLILKAMADYALFEPYFPQLLELQGEINCWKDEYNQAGHFPNLRTLILCRINISGEDETHWGKLLQIFETLKAPSLSVLDLRLNLPKNLAEIQDAKKCLQIGTSALNKRVNDRGKWEGTQTYFLGRGGYRRLRFSIKSEQEVETGTAEAPKRFKGGSDIIVPVSYDLPGKGRRGKP